MADHNFGLGKDRTKEIVSRIKALTKKAIPNGFTRVQLLDEMYDQHYIRSDELQMDHPWASVMMNMVEGYDTLTPLNRALRRYRLYQIKDHYGLSALEFLEAPADIAHFILEECKKIEKQIAARKRAELDQLNNNPK